VGSEWKDWENTQMFIFFLHFSIGSRGGRITFIYLIGKFGRRNLFCPILILFSIKLAQRVLFLPEFLIFLAYHGVGLVCV
jgi:hypothetical protein